MIDQTVQTFGGDLKDTTPNEGLSLMDQWIDKLQSANNGITVQIADTLQQLKSELNPQQNQDPDGSRIQSLLQNLVDQAQQVAQSGQAGEQQQELQQLVSTLQNLNQQVANGMK